MMATEVVLKAGNSSVLRSIHLSQHCFFPLTQVEKSGTSIHLKFQSVLAVAESVLLSPSTAALRSPYSFPQSADFRFATLVAGSRSSQIVSRADYPRKRSH
ncbi:hypothetical protein AVEN_222177-1 [Araneus ventricosus]|uniref:Uncharacterized protein n=1 Tax=Araneus ventricosus TaxID=182803 RepID=A0A4Y2FNS4_ARAVE|nr:hypothetical protein AVEN_222177-1 [Araneus ventricosus]